MDVREEIHECRSKWYDIGLKLRVPVGTLDSIEKHGNDSTCLREVLKHWLKNVTRPATWGALVNALDSQTVGEHKLASRLRLKYCQPKQSDMMSAAKEHDHPGILLWELYSSKGTTTSVLDNLSIVCKPFTQLSCEVSLLLPLMVLTKVGLKAAATEVKWALVSLLFLQNKLGQHHQVAILGSKKACVSKFKAKSLTATLVYKMLLYTYIIIMKWFWSHPTTC